MKLRILFFPIAVIISAALIIGFIYPDILTIIRKRGELENEVRMLNGAEKRKENVISLLQDMKSNETKSKEVMDYFPDQKYEEEIINKINRVAIDSGTVLTNLNFPSSKNVSKRSDVASQANVIDVTSEETPDIISSPKESVVELELFGSYKDIGSFLNRIYAMEKNNIIDSIVISESAGEDGNSGLMAKVTISFGYLPLVNVSDEYQADIFSNSQFNFGVIDRINSIIARKIPSVTIENAGRSNPFSL